MQTKLKIGLIYGSTREGRFCDTIATWAAQQVAKNDKFCIELIDPAAPPEKGNGWLKKSIGEADAFVVVTPEYNHGYPAALKSLVDSVGVEWHAKPVAFVSYGGVSGGLRAVEQLRQVFAELHAVTIRDSVSFAGAWELFEADGTLRNPARHERQMQTVLKRLAWWAETLRNGRNTVPYAPAA
jgi:NAD(P)H-dependent FMN reductase